MNKLLMLVFIVMSTSLAFAQNHTPSRLKVFFDCTNTWCDMQHIRSEINLIDYTPDNAAADVHLLINSQRTGSGGSEYQLIFFGQHSFRSCMDTLRFISGPDATDFERRDLLLKYIKTGLTPFIAKTSVADYIEITLKTSDTTTSIPVNDRWNAWVMRVGAGGHISADANYQVKNYDANLTANRITDELKTGIGLFWSKNTSSFKFEENDVTQNLEVRNHQWSVNQYVVKSITDHWSWAYELKYSQNTFSNNKGRAFLRSAIEYNIFRYDEVNSKLFTLSYGLTARRNRYYAPTIYDETKETLFGHMAAAYLSLNQKWGSSYAGISYHNYFHNWKFFNLGIELHTNVRITGGLSFYIFTFGGLSRDQLSLVRGDATPEEVLVRRRQLASGYNYYTSLGFTYRFGSQVNNVVNPRFDRSGSPGSE